MFSKGKRQNREETIDKMFSKGKRQNREETISAPCI